MELTTSVLAPVLLRLIEVCLLLLTRMEPKLIDAWLSEILGGRSLPVADTLTVDVPALLVMVTTADTDPSDWGLEVTVMSWFWPALTLNEDGLTETTAELEETELTIKVAVPELLTAREEDLDWPSSISPRLSWKALNDICGLGVA